MQRVYMIGRLLALLTSLQVSLYLGATLKHDIIGAL